MVPVPVMATWPPVTLVITMPLVVPAVTLTLWKFAPVPEIAMLLSVRPTPVRRLNCIRAAGSESNAVLSDKAVAGHVDIQILNIGRERAGAALPPSITTPFRPGSWCSFTVT